MPAEARMVDVVRAVTEALRTDLGVERHYAPSPEHVYDDKPWSREAWRSEAGVIVWVYPQLMTSEAMSTGRVDETLYVNVVAGRPSTASRASEMPGQDDGNPPWVVKARLAADIVNQIEAAQAQQVIPSSIVQQITHETNYETPEKGAAGGADFWDTVHVVLTVTTSRARGAA